MPAQRQFALRLSAAIVLAVALLPVAAAQTTREQIELEEMQRLDECLALAETDPDAAYEAGLKWLGEGARPAARFCTAMALVGKGNYAEGAWRLESLANAPDGGSDDRRVVYLAQAGNAWMAAQMPEEALAVITQALDLRPRNPGLLTDRAAALIMLDRAQEAIGDLNIAIEQVPDLADARFLRAKAYLATGRESVALTEIEAARELDPTNVDMVVLRGEIREAIRLKSED